MKSALAWKSYYARERARLGEAGLERLLERAPEVELPESGALVFPHTRLELSGELVAAAALACVRSGRASVLALGVLHGAREQDQGLVARARSGDAAALARLRRVHAGYSEHAQEEFSLDGFAALLERAARREGKPTPRLLARFPFLVGERPRELAGWEELAELVRSGAALVATADPIHHGAGYGTPLAEQRAASDAATRAWARATIEESFRLLAAGDVAGFLEHAARAKSDFRDPGPVLAALLRERGSGRAESVAAESFTTEVLALALVEYASVLEAPEPTWVAGALVRVSAL